jgi:hypothetical protein
MGMFPIQINEAVAVKKNITAVNQKSEPLTTNLGGEDEES